MPTREQTNAGAICQRARRRANRRPWIPFYLLFAAVKGFEPDIPKPPCPSACKLPLVKAVVPVKAGSEA